MSARHLRGIGDVDADGLLRLLDLTDHMAEVGRRANPKVPALRGRTVCNLFFEDSTRTRMSFDTAAKRLSADTMTLAVGSSSVNKGESLRDTVETLEAMGVDAFVIRHRSSGVPWRISEWCTASVINAGDGWHQHPTQALLDLYTIRTERAARGAEGFENLRVGIVGDIRHSRVARSLTEALVLLGASALHIGPRTLMPPTPLAPSTDDLDAALADLDVVYLLRMQLERIDSAVVPTGEEYSRRFALTPERAKRLGENVLVMHPGPMNRGVEITVDPAHLRGSVITQQVTNGIAARMAVLFDLLGGVDLDVGSSTSGSGVVAS